MKNPKKNARVAVAEIHYTPKRGEWIENIHFGTIDDVSENSLNVKFDNGEVEKHVHPTFVLAGYDRHPLSNVVRMNHNRSCLYYEVHTLSEMRKMMNHFGKIFS